MHKSYAIEKLIRQIVEDRNLMNKLQLYTNIPIYTFRSLKSSL